MTLAVIIALSVLGALAGFAILCLHAMYAAEHEGRVPPMEDEEGKK